MTEATNTSEKKRVEDIYDEIEHWHVNIGEEKIYAKRMAGRFRNLKWLGHSVWLVLFLGPYLRWGDRQAVLFDIPGRQFHIFDITILPQDIWMLSLTLLFFAILLAIVTSIAGRVYCGFFCFQTAWTDLFMMIEEKIEGGPAKRRKLDNGPLNATKIRLRTTKYFFWLIISVLTGISFAAWFTDAIELWKDLFTLNAHPAGYTAVGLFTAGTFILAGFLREQVCFWLCPYARIQGVMYDRETILPAYDYNRGEPRGKLKKGKHVEGQGDCIECNQCVAVCPTGIDIRGGQQEGCITCALCIDACDSVMEKIDKPKGLIRYASLDELEGKPVVPLLKRPRVLIYFGIITFAFVGILYGLTHLGAIELKVLHDRSPLFVRQSDGSIMNKYDLKILNKTDKPIYVTVEAEGHDKLRIRGAEKPLLAKPGHTTSHFVFITIPGKALSSGNTPITFRATDRDNAEHISEYVSMFLGPKR